MDDFAHTSAAAVECRSATSEDVDVLVSLIRMAYRGEVSRQGWTSEAEWVEGDRIDAEQVREIIENENSSMLLISIDGEVVGCCQIADIGNRTASFSTFAVKPSHQGRGLGRKLIEYAQRQIVDRYGSCELEIVVLAQQEKLIDWYCRLGFAPTGVSRPFPADARFARPLRDDLYFVVLSKKLPADSADL